MKINISKCNNIDDGEIIIAEGTLNVKYAINGTGKSTIAKAIRCVANHDDLSLLKLVPYKYHDAPEENKPDVSIDRSIPKTRIFDEDYLSQYTFQQDELLKGSFEIFVKTADYEQQMEKIRSIVKSVADVFKDDQELSELIVEFTEFIKGFGNARSGYAENGAIAKGIGKGNKIDNIPAGLDDYAAYLRSESNLEWLEWCLDGMAYRAISDKCPFCTHPLLESQAKLDMMSESYDVKVLKNFNKMASVFRKLAKYFSLDAKNNIDEILLCESELNDAKKNYLVEIRRQAEGLLNVLRLLSSISYATLKDEDDIAAKLTALKIDLGLYVHFKSDELQQKIGKLNASLTSILNAVNALKAEVGRQRTLIQNTVRKNQGAINDFLKAGGYPYTVVLEPQPDEKYRLVLRHSSLGEKNILDVKDHLSYGERNALGLALFMFSTLKEGAELIVLDDPISSFDGNKKFAILNLLFLGRIGECFKHQTVLMLTHELSPVIDVVKTMRHNFYPLPQASFLKNDRGHICEQEITARDIVCSLQVARSAMNSSEFSLMKVIHYRRCLEIEGGFGSLAYNLVSSLLHKRQCPTIGAGDGASLMTESDRSDAQATIKKYLPDFDYDTEYAKIIDRQGLVEHYRAATSGYEKLQIFRLIFENDEDALSDIPRKFVNETYHIENDYLFQLDPSRYDIIPSFVIDQLDEAIGEL